MSGKKFAQQLKAQGFDFGKQVQAVGPEDEEEEEEIGKFLEDLPVSVQRRVHALENIHKDHVSLEKQYRDEVAELEKKYLKLYAPLYTKRSAIVSGEYEPTDAEAKIEGKEVKEPKDKPKDEKGIPNFWLRVCQTNGSIGSIITEEDEPAISFLRDVRYEALEEGKHGFSLSFHFAENPFFTDSVLTKTYFLAEDDNMYGELVFDHAEGTKINWKPKKNLTVKLVEVKQKARAGKGAKRGAGAKTVTKEEPTESFFNFFSPPSPNQEAEDEDADLIDELLEMDFESGVIFKDKLIPHAALWFTGEAAQFEYDDDNDYDDFGGDFGDEDDEDDDEDDDDDEEDEPPRRGGRGGGAGRGGRGGAKALPPAAGGKGAPGQPAQPDCKQQ